MIVSRQLCRNINYRGLPFPPEHAIFSIRARRGENNVAQDTLKSHPYYGRTVTLATKHGKETVLGPPLKAAVGLMMDVPEDLDTDRLGTFTGEVPRIGSARATALKKARWGMAITGRLLGLASEGSFGPDPELLFVPTSHELLAFVDDGWGIEVIEQLIDPNTNYSHHAGKSLDDLEDFLIQAKFPSHGLIVRPNSGLMPDLLFKGITDTEALRRTLKTCASASEDGMAHVETDMRAFMNPTRRKVLGKVAHNLGRRLRTLCPQCKAPGWGMVDVIKGLPCEWCGAETLLTHKEVYGCPACDYVENHPRRDGLSNAPASNCPYCNP